MNILILVMNIIKIALPMLIKLIATISTQIFQYVIMFTILTLCSIHNNYVYDVVVIYRSKPVPIVIHYNYHMHMSMFKDVR